MNILTKEIQTRLLSLKDEEYRNFHCRLIPMIDPEMVIGIRVPVLRKLANQLTKTTDISSFLSNLPHTYYDENVLHALFINGVEGYDTAVMEINRFLPYVDNWAVCDTISPKAFSKHHMELCDEIDHWLKSTHTYTVRFGLSMLMRHYLDDDFEPEYLEIAAAVSNDDYYVNMMIAWYFATALTKQYEYAVIYIEENRLEKWVHNKAIQKAIESRCISKKHKAYLNTLKVKINNKNKGRI